MTVSSLQHDCPELYRESGRECGGPPGPRRQSWLRSPDFPRLADNNPRICFPVPCAPIDATRCHRRFVDKSVRRIPATSPGLEHRRLLHRSDTPCPARHPGSSPARRAILKRLPRRSETVCTGCIHCLSIRNELSILRPVRLAAGAKYSLTLTRRSKHCRSKALRGDLCISCGHPGPKPRSRRAYKRSVTHGRL
jgi:hypothetical protein